MALNKKKVVPVRGNGMEYPVVVIDGGEHSAGTDAGGKVTYFHRRRGVEM